MFVYKREKHICAHCLSEVEDFAEVLHAWYKIEYPTKRPLVRGTAELCSSGCVKGFMDRLNFNKEDYE